MRIFTLAAIVFILLAFVGWPLVLMWAWNTFPAAVLGLPLIGFWQAFAGMVLLNVIGVALRSWRA